MKPSRNNYTKPKKKIKMSETITAIHETDFKRERQGFGKHVYFDCFDGYIIQTDKRQIKVGISNSQSCCEHWGYLTTNDDINEFVGATLLEIKIVDTALNVKPLQEEEVSNCMFVNFSTDWGTMQLVAYNEHNGYYGHDAVVFIDDTVFHEEVL